MRIFEEPCKENLGQNFDWDLRKELNHMGEREKLDLQDAAAYVEQKPLKLLPIKICLCNDLCRVLSGLDRARQGNHRVCVAGA